MDGNQIEIFLERIEREREKDERELDYAAEEETEVQRKYDKRGSGRTDGRRNGGKFRKKEIWGR